MGISAGTNVSSSLRDQLLKAGLVTEKQARAAERGKQPPPRHGRTPPADQTNAADQARAAKLARDQQLNKQRQEAAEAKARASEIKQLIEQHKLPKVLESEERFHFVAGQKVAFILVDAQMRQGLNDGRLFIIRYGGRNEVVPAEIAERIRERDARAVIKLDAPQPPPAAEDDPYKDFVVPDDLKW
jgi:uncharacterized protein YaiL (DUF2058 family)